MSEEIKDIVRRYVDAITSGDLDRLDELMTADYVHHDPNFPPDFQSGLDSYKQGVRMFRVAFPDIKETMEDVIAEGDKVVTRHTWQGTHRGDLMGIPPSGKQVTFSMISVFRIAGGKMAEGWVNFDALGMMQQLGAIPAQG